ncbi:hypothetical protein STCU_11454 [Strigomonas culicis]|uniref:Uncharacterized protein n=1 Tax=Strigomonas culicis TaxID=28005 RepID=S9TH42_9TRYP|nr:hypothetical protein STCU_11454 [Strigomonas culicis]|eukprot:EPY16234.1 hypothetical protein STCU_11454 [Strigomonas culicis]
MREASVLGYRRRNIILLAILLFISSSLFHSGSKGSLSSSNRPFCFPIAAAATVDGSQQSQDAIASANAHTSPMTRNDHSVDDLPIHHAYALQVETGESSNASSDSCPCCICGGTTTTEPVILASTSSLFGLWVFIGVFGSLVVVILISYISDYIIQPVPPQKTLLPIPVINNNNHSNDYSVSGNMISGASGADSGIPPMPIDPHLSDDMDAMTAVSKGIQNGIFGKTGDSITEELLRQTPAGVLRQRHTLNTTSHVGSNDPQGGTSNSKWRAGTTDSASDPYGGATRTANLKHLYEEDDDEEGHTTGHGPLPLHPGPYQQSRSGTGGGVALFDTPSSMRSGMDSAQETPLSYISSPSNSDRKQVRRRNFYPTPQRDGSCLVGAIGGSDSKPKRSKATPKHPKHHSEGDSGSEGLEDEKSSSNSQKVIKFDAYI